jgi:DNA primase
MSDVDIRIDVLAEFNRLGLTVQPTNSPDWLMCLCPFHGDTTASCCINITDQYFTCKACPANGKIPKLLARMTDTPLHDVLAALFKLYGKQATEKPVETDLV